MDHSEATRINASERYGLGELTPREVEAFEEHFFGCASCAQDLAFENAFAENVKAVFREQSALAPPGVAAAAKPKWWEWLGARWTFVPLVSTACLLALVGFENLSTIPQLRTEVAQLASGEAPFPVPLSIARGSEAVSVPRESFLFTPYFFLPPAAASRHYICDIETAGGLRVKHLIVSAPPAGQPLAVLLKRSDFPSGVYRVIVRGENASAPIQTYTMTLSTL